jgi:hypothetical protein
MTVQVPAVTVQPDRDLEQCAELHFSLAGRDKEEKIWEDREMAFSHHTNFVTEAHDGKRTKQ